ncbi:hypothetical protein TNCV_850341 [Trichonephila clavipes]|uniref:Uncharacterized protein n=1 Tax=Trichonephila clavipes TaxID=2585209 RepID=A0A8X6RWC4_TRICX|nr:hypothetical protein TNCV_850341 [Trichonephila clavipes]
MPSRFLHLYRILKILGSIYNDATPTKFVTFSKIEGTQNTKVHERWVVSVERDRWDLGVNRWQSIAPISQMEEGHGDSLGRSSAADKEL